MTSLSEPREDSKRPKLIWAHLRDLCTSRIRNKGKSLLCPRHAPSPALPQDNCQLRRQRQLLHSPTSPLRQLGEQETEKGLHFVVWLLVAPFCLHRCVHHFPVGGESYELSSLSCEPGAGEGEMVTVFWDAHMDRLRHPPSLCGVTMPSEGLDRS